MNLLASFKPIKLIAMDIDGVLTDGSLILLPDFTYGRTMHIRDGYALQLAIKQGYHLMVISGAQHDNAVENRLKKLGVTDLHMGVQDKASLLEKRRTELGFTTEQTLFIGDDMPDINALKIAGLPCCPSDACIEVLQRSSYISPMAGGKGCVRDVIEKVLRLNDHWHVDDQLAAR